jgi:hypothetical protein
MHQAAQRSAQDLLKVNVPVPFAQYETTGEPELPTAPSAAQQLM